MSTITSNNIILNCVQEGSKLRVKILSPGYLPDSNCQFPRNLRIPGRKFSVNSNDIKLMTTRGKYFYSVKKNITILDDDFIYEEKPVDISNLQIYEDNTNNDCIICMENNKQIVFGPCGHFYTCSECSIKLDKCPCCRTKIINKINRNLFS